MGIFVFNANMPCPVNGKNINNGAKVVKAPNMNPEKQDIFRPINIKQM